MLFDVIDKTMRQVFRDAGVQVIYDFLEKNSRLKPEEIVEKPEAFSAGLERLLGSGALVIEKLILKNLYRKIDLKFEEKKGFAFSDYVKDISLKGEVK